MRMRCLFANTLNIRAMLDALASSFVRLAIFIANTTPSILAGNPAPSTQPAGATR